MTTPAQRRLGARVIEYARQVVLDYPLFADFERAVVSGAIRLGRGVVKHWGRVQIGRWAARTAWDEPLDLDGLDDGSRAFLDMLRDDVGGMVTAERAEGGKRAGEPRTSRC